jgi:membrane protein DedA with SNARE-associated domain
MSIAHGLSVIESWVAAYGAVALFVLVYFESFGAPLPGESALIGASVLAARGDLNMAAVVAAAWGGAVLGDATGYLIGRLGGRPLLMRFGARIGLTAERFDVFAGKLLRHGFALVVIARFVVPLRQLNGLIAGAVVMPPVRFAAANMLGAALWVSLWTLGAHLLGGWLSLPHSR